MNRTLILQVLWFLLLVWFARGALSLAPWVPTRKQDLKQIAEIADLKSGQVFLEFGCGTSHVSRYIATMYPEAHIIGVEVAFPFFIYARLRQKIYWPENLEIILKDGFRYDLKNVDVIYTFGLPDTVNIKMKKKLLEEMKPWAKFLSYVFSINDRDWWITEHIRSEHNEGKIHVFTKL